MEGYGFKMKCLGVYLRRDRLVINSDGGRPTLSVGSTIPQAGVSHQVKKIKQTVHQSSWLCFLILNAMTVSYLVCHAIPAMILESKQTFPS